MSVVLVTGSGGLIGSESVKFFHELGFSVVGIDNDMRKFFFGDEASTRWNVERLKSNLKNYTHFDADIRDETAIGDIFNKYRSDLKLIIHTAAQPSHDWAAQDPFTDFTVNANGTLNLLEHTRQIVPDAVFIFCSTNKVYGDTPNRLPLVELEKRWEIAENHPYFSGITEDMSIDQTKHSLFGASKVAADVLVQEYGRYFDMKTAIFRGGCLTGPSHSGTQLHGFLAYLMKCTMTGQPYTVFGYKGKQVRDNIHAYDVARFIEMFYEHPQIGAVFNLGGGRGNSVSILEAFDRAAQLTGKKMQYSYSDQARAGDHICYISNLNHMRESVPGWDITRSLDDIFEEIVAAWHTRLKTG